jgi:tetratricopeptide (TPR) repeat protein
MAEPQGDPRIQRAEWLRENGDLEGAKALLRAVIDAGDPERAAEALVELTGLHWWDEDDNEAAKKTYERAIEIGGGASLSWALTGLARIAGDEGDTARAATLYERAVEEGDPELASYALHELGELLAKADRMDEAEVALRRAVATGDNQWARVSLSNLAWVDLKRGKLDLAADEFRQLIETNDPEWIGGGYLGLGATLDAQGDSAGAKTAYEAVFESVQVTDHLMALVRLRGVLLRAGDREAADEVYRRVREAGGDEWTSLTFNLLGEQFKEAGDFERC